jgi:hypothetical protein
MTANITEAMEAKIFRGDILYYAPFPKLQSINRYRNFVTFYDRFRTLLFKFLEMEINKEPLPSAELWQ